MALMYMKEWENGTEFSVTQYQGQTKNMRILV